MFLLQNLKVLNKVALVVACTLASSTFANKEQREVQEEQADIQWEAMMWPQAVESFDDDRGNPKPSTCNPYPICMLDPAVVTAPRSLSEASYLGHNIHA